MGDIIFAFISSFESLIVEVRLSAGAFTFCRYFFKQ